MTRPAKITAIDGGDGEPPFPIDWKTTYSDKAELASLQEEWNLVISEMKTAQTLSVVNGHAVRRLVEFRHQYRKAAAHVAQHGPMLPARDPEAAQDIWNPMWAVMRHCEKAIRDIESELCLAPLRRGRAGKVEKRARQSRPSDAYLKRG